MSSDTPPSVAKDISRGHRLRREGRFHEALVLADRAVAQAPSSPEALMLLAGLRTDLHWLSGTTELQERVLHSRPGDLSLRLELIRRYRKHGNAAGAAKLCADGLAQHPDHRDLAWQHIESCLDANENRQALAALDDLGETSTRLAQAYVRAGDLEKARATAEAVTGDADALIVRARVALWTGDRDSATTLAQQALEIAGQHADAHATLAAVALDAGDLDRASDAADAGINADPRCGEAQLIGAEIARKRGEQGAFDLIEQLRVGGHGYLIGMELNRFILLFQRAFHFEARHRRMVMRQLHKRAPQLIDAKALSARHARDQVTALEQALRRLGGNRTATPTVGGQRVFIPPDPGTARTTARELIVMLGFDAAINHLDALLRDYGPDPLIHTQRGEFLLWQGRYAESVKDFVAAVWGTRRTVWSYIGLSASLLMLGQPRAALAVSRASRLFVPLGPSGLIYRGEAYRRLGKYRAAERTLEAATKQAPTRVSVWVNFALLGHETNRPQLMADCADKARKLAPPLWADLQRAVPNASPVDQLEHALVMMRGNRASRLVTYFDRDDVPHYVDTGRYYDGH